MAEQDSIQDIPNIRSRASAVAAQAGSIAIENVGGVLKQVDDQGVATTIGVLPTIAANSIAGNNTGSPAPLASLSVAQVNSLLGYPTTIASELATLLGLSGISGANASVDWSDFTEDVQGSTQLWTHTGTFSNSQVLKGGWATANTAGGSSIIRPTTAGVLGRATEAFGFGWRGKFDASSVAAGCLFRGSFIDAAATTKGFFIGFYGTTFTGDGTKFIAATYDGTTAKYYASTIAIDNAKHNFRIWSTDGATFLFAVDNETPITMNAGNLPANTVYLKAFFDTNTAQNQSYDYFVAVTVRD